MGDIVNLRTARKRNARMEKENRAAANRAAHGRSKAEMELSQSIRNGFKSHHEAHLRQRRKPGEDD